jgi:fructose-1,6-bisphosphatase/inositol monophosphatase family enzyme
MKYSPTIKYLLDIIAKSSKSLLRDYNELVYMQSSIKSTEDFVKRSRTRSADLIINEIEFQKKYTPNIRLDGVVENFGNKYTIIIEPLDGLTNFQHALPFFAMAASLKDEEKGEIIASIIELPSFREIFVAEKNNGAWHDSYLNSANAGSRLRVANRNKKDSMYFVSDHIIKPLEDQTLILNSPLASIAMMTFGRFDACVFTKIAEEHIALTELIIREAGGTIYKSANTTIFAYEKSLTELKKIMEV